MATTFVEYTGDGNATKSFSFPSYQESDVKVRVDGVLKTTSTHYNITNYTTTGGGNVVFTSGNIPSSPANIRIYRDTNVDTAKATFTAGSSVKAADLNNNTTQLLYRAQEEQIPNLIHSYDIDDGAIETSKIKADAITGAKIADDQINSEHYVDGSIDTAHIADAQITTAKLAADSVTNAKIADDSIDSEHYVDGSIDTAHIADDAITTAKIAANAVTAAKIANGTITNAQIADSTIGNTQLAGDAVNGTKIADNSIDSEHYVDGSIDTAHIGNLQVTTAKIAADAVDGTKIADDSINSEHYVDGSIDTAHIADSQITAAKIASNAVTTDKIQDGELTTLAGMQSATASKLADSTALTADIADLNQIDGMAKQTTITDDDTKFPTSGAVVDYVAAQLEPFGGFEAIANESSFPNTQPASGVAISIADAGGMTVSSSGTASGATVGGTTVNISGIPSNFFSSTVSAGVRFIVTSTGSGQNYTYHKATLKEDDLLNLSGDINDFSERYRVGSSNPTSSLDSGDLFFNTGTGKLLVYNGTNSAWEEAQSVGNFFINTISSSSATGGGSATPNGTAYRFTLSNAGTNAEQHLVSVDGVVQKPNSGSSQPSEGFAVSGADIIFGSAPVSGASIFVITIGSTVNIGTPSNNTVTTAILQNGSVTTAKIVDANVTTAKITDDAVTGAKLANDIAISTTGTIASSDITIQNDNPKIVLLDTNNNDDFSIRGSSGMFRIRSETDSADRLVVNSDGHTDIKGNLDCEAGLDVTGEITATSHIDIPDNAKIKIGSDDDLELFHDGSNSFIKDSGTGNLNVLASAFVVQNDAGTENIIRGFKNGTVELYYDNVKKFETTSGGVSVTGNLIASGNVDANSNGSRVSVGDNADLLMTHINNGLIDCVTGELEIIAQNNIFLKTADSKSAISCNQNGAVELYFDNSKKFETLTGGAKVTGNFISTGDVLLDSDSNKLKIGLGEDLQLYHDGSNSLITNSTGELKIGSNHIELRNAAQNSTRLAATSAGAVELFYDNSKTFETISNGTKITGVIQIDRGSAVDEALSIDTTGTTGASRITFKESGTAKGELAYSHGNDQVELVAKTGNGAAIIVNQNQTALLINSDGYVTKPKNPVFHAFGGPSNVALNTDIVFGQERFDVGGGYNTSNGIYTVPRTGYYHFYGQVYRQSTENDAWWGFFINGGQKSEARLQNNYGSDSARGYATLQCSLYWYCSAGDQVKMRVGNTGAIHCNNTLSYFCGNLVG